MTETLIAPIGGLPAGDSGPIALRGSGVLYEVIQSALDTRPEHSAALSASCPAVLVVVGEDTVGPDTAGPDGVSPPAVPWLPVWWEPGHVLLGPARLPGVPGCPTCAERRRRRNRPDWASYQAMRERFGAELAARGTGPLGGLTAGVLAALVVTEATCLARDPRSARTRSALLSVAVETARISRHPILPDPLCPECSALPLDSPEAARIVLSTVRKPAPGTFRVRDAAAALPTLERLYTDPETGVIAHLSTGMVGGCAISMAALEPATARSAGQSGYGRALSFHTARLSALTEALERYAGRAPRGRRTAVRARYVDVADHAVDPTTFGLFPDERHDLPEFPYRRYRPERELPWVWGYSFVRQEPVLVPENLAYYTHGSHAGADEFIYEVSNGCALGGCLAEAVLHGLLEVAERDAFLMTWYARLPAPRVDLDSAADRAIPLLVERVRQALGYEILCFDTTLEHGIPSFWLLAVDARPGPTRLTARPTARLTALCAAGAHLIPEHALLGSLCELTSALGARLAEYPDRDTAEAARLLADPDAVRTMDQHGLLYSQPQAFDRFAFLPLDGPARPLADVASRSRWPARSDLAEDLCALVGRYLDTGLDVIVVNQSTPEHQAGGLSCVKVLVPGTLSMTFGHRFRRTDGIPRLLSVPRLLGHHVRDLRPDEINPHPHPFP
ncbi:MAG: TOMM precursor leader peptide-binding protein [Pseudonocardiaceae bacterium]